MNSRLKQIPNWPELAQLHRYCVATLAEHLGCSRRQLGRYIRRTQRQSAAIWLNELRQTRAFELLRAHHRVTDVGRALHYKKIAHFSRAFKKFYGVPPREWTFIIPMSQKVPYRIQMSHKGKSGPGGRPPTGKSPGCHIVEGHFKSRSSSVHERYGGRPQGQEYAAHDGDEILFGLRFYKDAAPTRL